ncbi:MAG TPA: acyl carrier protein [Vicinamibacterales bacterium]|nr:acyl carrier protein [Vicinamibacterales bacterium]
MTSLASDDIETDVRSLIESVTRHSIDSVSADDDLVEVLGIDSLQGLQMLAGVEKHFGIRLPDDQLIHMRTIGRIADAVRARKAA